ncbi:hypothetical protein [Fibrobacter sp.]|uniref:hypothetical protein n=1 Tax=Fibrobacter sp. TaxID=35828 RepID=UPI0025C43AD9|nr:hypothetical protein [Fibrobacter sp.]MBR4007886.1 hypothetical protein [Fibrobacter sp.]
MWRMLLVGVFGAVEAFALDIDSLPVWNPEILVRGVEPVVQDSAGTQSRLETHGIKTMQVTVGDGDTQVDQMLKLSIMGYVGDSVYIDALLSDVDRKAGDQTTATLQEVDQVYFRATSRHWMLHLGDLTWTDFDLGLMSIERSTLGAMVGFKTNLSEVWAAAGTGEANRIVRTFNGVSGQREGYALSAFGEYISVVPGSEAVWLNGEKLQRGTDYEVNYAGGLLNFKGLRMPGIEDEIRVEYDAYDEDQIENLYAATGKFRHPNLYLDVSGFRLENDVSRLKKGVWTDEDYAQLKNDDGSELVRDDSLGSLSRPSKVDAAAARLRFQGRHRYFIDLELAMSRRDSNTVSENIGGPEGRAFRWFLTTDSSAAMKRFPVAFSVYGNYVENGFDVTGFKGSDDDWSSYKLKDEWDLDSSLLSRGNYRHDEFAMRVRLGPEWSGNLSWGYRQGDDMNWNSSRIKGTLLHKQENRVGEISLVHVQSEAEAERRRFQGMFSEKWIRGLVQPLVGADIRYTERDSASLDDAELSLRGNVGTVLAASSWNVREVVEVWKISHGGDSYFEPGEETFDDWVDSLRQIRWTQSAEMHFKDFDLSHFLQYEHRDLEASGEEHAWAGDLNAKFGNERTGIQGNVSYKLGLTEEQTYTAIYKAVAKGTGDVRYDSLTGAFIEGVDNGDFVYEGMGRNDSIGAVLASNASFNASLEWSPGRAFGIDYGILRDIKLGGTLSLVTEDTSGKIIYFPMVLPSTLSDFSSGSIQWTGNVEWAHPSGAMLAYKPSAAFDKKLSFIEYYESVFHHEIVGGFRINDNHYVGAEAFTENVELQALQDLEWNIKSVAGRYRFSFLDGFSIEPGGRYRYGSGEEIAGNEFDAYLWEASLRFGYTRTKLFDGFARFSTVRVETDDNIPYQMMSGYSAGMTYRLEASAQLSVNQNISFGLHYVLRFGDAEENIFQKLSMEARAMF